MESLLTWMALFSHNNKVGSRKSEVQSHIVSNHIFFHPNDRKIKKGKEVRERKKGINGKRYQIFLNQNLPAEKRKAKATKRARATSFHLFELGMGQRYYYQKKSQIPKNTRPISQIIQLCIRLNCASFSKDRLEKFIIEQITNTHHTARTHHIVDLTVLSSKNDRRAFRPLCSHGRIYCLFSFHFRTSTN